MPVFITEDVNVYLEFSLGFFDCWIYGGHYVLLLENVNMDQQSFYSLVFTSAFLRIIICLSDDDRFLNNFTIHINMPLLFRLNHFITLER